MVQPKIDCSFYWQRDTQIYTHTHSVLINVNLFSVRPKWFLFDNKLRAALFFPEFPILSSALNYTNRQLFRSFLCYPYIRLFISLFSMKSIFDASSELTFIFSFLPLFRFILSLSLSTLWASLHLFLPHLFLLVLYASNILMYFRNNSLCCSTARFCDVLFLFRWCHWYHLCLHCMSSANGMTNSIWSIIKLWIRCFEASDGASARASKVKRHRPIQMTIEFRLT